MQPNNTTECLTPKKPYCMLLTKSIVTFLIFGFNSLFLSTNDGDRAKPLAELHAHAEIEILQNQNKASVNISDGDQLVFYIDDVNIGEVYFQIPEYRRFFRYTDGLMKNVNLIVVQHNKIVTPQSGEVNGFKISEGIWKINLTLNSEKPYMISRRVYQEQEVSTAQN